MASGGAVSVPSGTICGKGEAVGVDAIARPGAPEGLSPQAASDAARIMMKTNKKYFLIAVSPNIK